MRYVLRSHEGHWQVEIDPDLGVCHLGLDSEGTGRERANLLTARPTLSFCGANANTHPWQMAEGSCFYTISAGTANTVTWRIRQHGNDMLWEVECSGHTSGLCISLPFDPLMAAAVLIPAQLNEENRGLPPWLLVAPDYGHLLVEIDSPAVWTCANTGRRGGSAHNAPSEGLNPRLRGSEWLKAARLPDYRPGELSLQFRCEGTVPPGSRTVFRFRPVELQQPQGVTSEVWRQIRRSYLNHWQPCGSWCGPERAMVLANNVLSDPASISLAFYAEPMRFWRQPVPGIDLSVLLRHSLDYWLDRHVSFFGHVNAFGHMFDLYVCTGATLLVAAYHYWAITQDAAWLESRLPKLHAMGDFLLRRDVDRDGLVESINSGNAGTLREPDRADIWFEMMNFGHKNAYTNAHAYRAFHCLADMLAALEHPGGAEHYRRAAARLRDAYVKTLLSPEHGWFVSWISQDGEVHDYCHTFINGLAVAYGIVPPSQGRDILRRVVAQSHSIGFTCWHLGVPGNLLPCRKADMIGPPIGLDGEPVQDHWGYWPDELTEQAAFGYRYPNGTVHPTLVWPYLLGLQVAGLEHEANRILNLMTATAQAGLFQNGIVNTGYGGAEHFYANGNTCGYEGYLPESFNFLMAHFTQSERLRALFLAPLPSSGAQVSSGER
jgi:hypothetical protein